MVGKSSINMIDFLKPGVNQVRKSIQGIDDSYNNEWDILAELIQNAVDAIRQRYNYLGYKVDNYRGKIDIYIDAVKKIIEVSDNGVGISSEELPNLIGPFSSGKENDASTVGEKGVGLTFALFSSNKFEITTGQGDNCSRATVVNALNWKKSSDEKMLQLEIGKHDTKHQGTSITLSEMEELDLFNLNHSQMKFLLRTITAIGNTEQIWNDDIDIDVTLKFIDKNNKLEDGVVPFKYFNIIDELGPQDKVDIDYFIEKSSNAIISDKEKRLLLKDKIVYGKGTFTHAGNRHLNYLAYFVPSRAAWEGLNKNFGLLSDDMNESELTNHLERYYYAHLESGIYTAVKGMPTGISINHPSTGNAGYWPNMFILFQDNLLSFDIGRKSIHGSQQNIIRKYSKELFNKFTKIMTRYGTRSFTSDGRDWNRENTFENIRSMRELEDKYTKNTSFQYSPHEQEAQVSAMFYEQIGKGNIKDLKLFTTGYKGKYDLYAKLEDKGNVVIEFKSSLRNILKDFNDEQKLFDEIDCVVCWGINETDQDKFHEHGISITDLGAPSLFSSGLEEYPNVTHRLELSGFAKPIYVIDLKVVMDKI